MNEFTGERDEDGKIIDKRTWLQKLKREPIRVKYEGADAQYAKQRGKPKNELFRQNNIAEANRKIKGTDLTPKQTITRGQWPDGSE